ncbi:DUF7681 family protein [Pseudoxanthomonas sp.]|jgi:hypothetical protein|uniref:Acb2/Tad1 domain-containing protein n=1 Tax=Pseudoxanthomonas sp. TaxID=1871049 RepID=UPI002E142D69|nr:hypothetical protein [Pseudoxanthomonas sp.]
MFDTSSVAPATVEAYDQPASSEVDTTVIIARMIRTKAAELRELLQHVESHLDDQHAHAKATHDIDEMQRLQDADPYRWLADAKHALQSGVMFADRALTQPTGF